MSRSLYLSEVLWKGMGSTTPATWKIWVCATVLVLFANTTLEREYQLFHQLTEAPTPVGRDFAVYYVAGRVALGEGEGRLYYCPTGNKTVRNREILQGNIPSDTAWSRLASRAVGLPTTMHYIYPPFFAVLFSPLSRMQPREAYFLWRGLSLAMLLLSTYLILRSFQLEGDLSAILIATVGVLSFFPFAETLYEGQVSCLVLFLWTMGFYCTRTRRIAISAACFAIGTAIKLTPAIVVPIMLLRRQWKWLLSYVAASAALLALSLWRIGWEAHRFYISEVLPSMSAGMGGYLPKSLGTVVRNIYWRRVIFGPKDSWEVPSSWNLLIRLGSFALYAGVLYYFWKKRNPDEVGLSEELTVAALLSLLISPLTWRHHFVLVLLPLVYAWVQSRERGQKVRLYALALVTVSIGTPIADFILLRVHSGLLQALLSSLSMLAGCTLLLLCLREYRLGEIIRPQFVPTRVPALAARLWHSAH